MNLGMAVKFSDGWSGRVESIGGGIIAVLGDGGRGDDHWCGTDYRLVGPSAVTIECGTARAVWKPTVEQRRAGIVADIICSALSSALER